MSSMNIRDYDFVETCRCPECGEWCHPEWLFVISATGEVVGCYSCVTEVEDAG